MVFLWGRLCIPGLFRRGTAAAGRPRHSQKKRSGGSRTGKCCGLRSSRFSPRPPQRRRHGGFPLWPRCRVATSRTGLPLSPHFNPRPTSCEQPRSFPRRSHLPLAPFAGLVSAAIPLALRWPASGEGLWNLAVRCCIHHPHSGQATLHTTHHHVSASHAGVHCAVAALLAWCNRHARRPPRKKGRRPHAIADRPSFRRPGSAWQSARRPNPQHQPPIGHRRPTPETSSMCPLTDF